MALFLLHSTGENEYEGIDPGDGNAALGIERTAEGELDPPDDGSREWSLRLCEGGLLGPFLSASQNTIRIKTSTHVPLWTIFAPLCQELALRRANEFHTQD
jgi:hypothetical protein